MSGLLVVQKKFPNPRVLIPMVIYSMDLLSPQHGAMRALNDIIHKTGVSLPYLCGTRFQTEIDKVHWTAKTATEMLKCWIKLKVGIHRNQAYGTVVNLLKSTVQEFNMPELQVQATAYHRRLRLAAFFRDGDRDACEAVQTAIRVGATLETSASGGEGHYKVGH